MKQVGDTYAKCTALDLGDSAKSIAAFGGAAYWSSFSSIRRVAAGDGGTAVSFLDGLFFPGDIAIEATDLYFSQTLDMGPAVGIFRVDLAGGVPERYSVGNLASVFALDLQHLYFGDAAVGGWSLHRVSRHGGSTVDIAKGGAITSVALGANHVYWIDSDKPTVYRVPYAAIPANVVTTPEGGARLSTDPSAVESFAAVTGNDIFVRTGFVYLADRLAGTLVRYPEVTGAIPVILVDGLRPQRLLVDDRSVYFTTTTSNFGDLVMRTPTEGGPIELVAEVPGFSIKDIAMDESGVYLGLAIDTLQSNGVAGAILRVSK